MGETVKRTRCEPLGVITVREGGVKSRHSVEHRVSKGDLINVLITRNIVEDRKEGKEETRGCDYVKNVMLPYWVGIDGST